jgi:hypothetical protein
MRAPADHADETSPGRVVKMVKKRRRDHMDKCMEISCREGY